jgi:oligopeptide transport system substrate-binding protein
VAAGKLDFDWPEEVSPEVRQRVLERIIAYREKPDGDLWEQANVGVVAVSDFVLRLELEKPAPYFLGTLANAPWYPVHPPTIEKHGGMTKRDSLWTRPENFVGNGAYILNEWVVNRHLHLVKRDDYWDADRMRLKEIYFYPIDNLETEQRAFRSGYAHVTSTVPPHRIDFNHEHYPNNQRFDPYLGVYYYNIKVTPPTGEETPEELAIRQALSDRRVRQALAMSINRESIVRYLGAGQLPAYSFVPPNTAGYNSRHKIPYDPEKARQLLAEAGYPGGVGFPQIELLYNTSEAHKQIAEIIQQMWKEELGIDLAIVNQEWKVFLGTLNRRNFDLARAGWIGDYVDPSTFLDLWLTGGGNNRTGFSDSRYDFYLDKAARTFDPKVRMEAFQEAERILMEELPVLPIYYYVSSKMIRESVQGWYPNLLDRHPYKYVHLESAE